MPSGKMAFAVAENSWRGFHRTDKRCGGAMAPFHHYFAVDPGVALVQQLSAIHTRQELNQFANDISTQIRDRLTNTKLSQLASYNRLRKPIDLYLEHLVAMSNELEPHRTRLVPLLSLPLDSQMFENPLLFSETELKDARLRRSSSYGELRSEQTYRNLQNRVVERARVCEEHHCAPFHPIYFDLLWNNRFQREGTNLFLLNPPPAGA